VPWRQRCVRTHKRNCILSGTFNQCSSRRSDLARRLSTLLMCCGNGKRRNDKCKTSTSHTVTGNAIGKMQDRKTREYPLESENALICACECRLSVSFPAGKANQGSNTIHILTTSFGMPLKRSRFQQSKSQWACFGKKENASNGTTIPP